MTLVINMAISGYSSWWKRKIWYKTPLYKRQACGNFHWFLDALCYCTVNFNGQTEPIKLKEPRSGGLTTHG